MIKLKRDTIPVTIDDDFNVIVDNRYKDFILPLVDMAKRQAETDYSVSDGFYSYFLADYLKKYGFEVLEVADVEEKETELLVY